MTRNEVEALFVLAGIQCELFEEIRNQYWPSHPDYNEVREANPWYRVNLREGGFIIIGWRKRVISIDWENTNRRGVLTQDDVTKDITYVHAWNFAKAVEYLTLWRSLPAVVAKLPS